MVLRNRPIIFFEVVGSFPAKENKHAERPDPKEKSRVGIKAINTP
jgi:hypothetical protein